MECGWDKQSARPATASRWSWSPGTWRPPCLFSPSRCNSAPEERLKSISQYTLATKHTTLSSEAVHQNLYQPLFGEIVRAPAEWSPLEGVKTTNKFYEDQKTKVVFRKLLQLNFSIGTGILKQIRVWFKTQKHWRLSSGTRTKTTKRSPAKNHCKGGGGHSLLH